MCILWIVIIRMYVFFLCWGYHCHSCSFLLLSPFVYLSLTATTVDNGDKMRTLSVYRNEIAYASSDHMVYIRKFSTVGSEMILLNTLQGHFGEVVSVCWNPVRNVWVTGSDDGTIRVWVRGCTFSTVLLQAVST